MPGWAKSDAGHRAPSQKKRPSSLVGWRRCSASDGQNCQGTDAAPLAAYPAAQEGMSLTQLWTPVWRETLGWITGSSSTPVAQDLHGHVDFPYHGIQPRFERQLREEMSQLGARGQGGWKKKKKGRKKKESQQWTTMETAPLFPSPPARMYPWVRTKRPLDALAETSTEGTPTRPHVWFQLRPRPHLEASSDGPRHRLLCSEE